MIWPPWQDVASILALVLVTLAAPIALYARRIPVGPVRESMGFLDHVREIGSRIKRLAILWAYWTLLLLTVRFRPMPVGDWTLPRPEVNIYDNAAAQVYRALAHRVVPPDVTLLVTRPTEAVAAQLALAFALAVILSLPALALELWAFFSPGLTPRERRALARAIPLGALLFAGGVTFAIVYVVPVLMRTLYAFAAPMQAQAFLTVGSLLSQTALFALFFGFAFELPLVMVMLVRLGVAQPQTFVRYGRHATFAIFAVAALVTDPTIVSQLIVGALLLSLYWGGVAASMLMGPARPAPVQE